MKSIIEIPVMTPMNIGMNIGGPEELEQLRSMARNSEQALARLLNDSSRTWGINAKRGVDVYIDMSIQAWPLFAIDVPMDERIQEWKNVINSKIWRTITASTRWMELAGTTQDCWDERLPDPGTLGYLLYPMRKVVKIYNALAANPLIAQRLDALPFAGPMYKWGMMKDNRASTPMRVSVLPYMMALSMGVSPSILFRETGHGKSYLRLSSRNFDRERLDRQETYLGVLHAYADNIEDPASWPAYLLFERLMDEVIWRDEHYDVRSVSPEMTAKVLCASVEALFSSCAPGSPMRVDWAKQEWVLPVAELMSCLFNQIRHQLVNEYKAWLGSLIEHQYDEAQRVGHPRESLQIKQRPFDIVSPDSRAHYLPQPQTKDDEGWDL